MQTAIKQHQEGMLQQAEQLYRQVLMHEPENVYAMNLLGVVARQAGQNDSAVGWFHKALAIKPDFAEAYNNLGNAFMELKDLEAAAENFRKALAINPDLAVVHNNLGNVLHAQGHLPEAIACYRRALALKPDYAGAYNNLGKLLKIQGDLDQALTCYRRALAINPKLFEAHNNAGNVLNEQGQLAAAIASYNKALALKPDYGKALNNLGRVLKDRGDLQAAVKSFQNALAVNPELSGAHSNLLFTLNYLPGCSQEEIYEESLQWNRKHAAPLLQGEPVYRNTREAGRRLRVGYVSPDFRIHSVAYFFEPVLMAHDRKRVDVYCYANVARPDEVTSRLQDRADCWYSILGKSEADINAQIKKDKIDILVDLTGHTGGNSLLVFARKPAPVQLTWMGYPNTTGLSTMDYRITDGVADPVGKADRLHSEELVRLDNGFLCYRADDSAPAAEIPPCLKQGHITFGNFNDLAKTNHEVVKLWAKILHAVPGSRLLMKAKQLADAEVKDRYLAMFIKEDVAYDRIEMQARLPKKEDHLALYNRVDIGLDPFPYNGTTTTCEALWMGVPVVTLLGKQHAGRVCASILQRLGLAELIAETSEMYLEIVVKLANDRDRLRDLRANLRARMQTSPLMDSRNFTRELEKAYRLMWQRWCEKSL